jgi:hypothetical protein
MFFRKNSKCNTQWQHEPRCKCHHHQHNIVHQMKKDSINPFNLECWNWGKNDHTHTCLSKSLNVHSPIYLPTLLMHRICDKIKPGYLKAHIMDILHTYPEEEAGGCLISSLCGMYVPTYIPGTRCCIQISIHWNTSISLASHRLASHSLRAPIACASTSVVPTLLLPYCPRFPAFSSLSPALLSFSQKSLSFFVY